MRYLPKEGNIVTFPMASQLSGLDIGIVVYTPPEANPDHRPGKIVIYTSSSGQDLPGDLELIPETSIVALAVPQTSDDWVSWHETVQELVADGHIDPQISKLYEKPYDDVETEQSDVKKFNHVGFLLCCASDMEAEGNDEEAERFRSSARYIEKLEGLPRP